MKFKPALLHFRFDKFESLPSELGQSTFSEIQTDCNGHKWHLALYPGGSGFNDEPGWSSLYLTSISACKSELDVRVTFTVKDAHGATAKHIEDEFNFYDGEYSEEYSEDEFMKRSDILDTSKDILNDGALHIDVSIQVKDKKDHLFHPQSAHSSRLLDWLKSGDDADTTFNVGGKIFKVHSQIINAHAPLIGNHCSDVIKDIRSDVFQLLLEHIYSGRQPEDADMLKHGKALIEAANKYELVELKMCVENILVRERILNKVNVSDFILFAEAQSCPLLKEYAISYFIVHYKEVLISDNSKDLKQSGELLSEIMTLMKDDNPKALTVDVLRKELGKRKLDVDGSKDALIARLEEAKRQRTD